VFAPKSMSSVRNLIACCILWVFPLLAAATAPVAGDQSARATFFAYDLMASAASLSLGATTASCNSQRDSVYRAWWVDAPGLSSSVPLVSLDGSPVAARAIGHSVDDLSRAAGALDKNGVSAAAKALQSHLACRCWLFQVHIHLRSQTRSLQELRLSRQAQRSLVWLRLVANDKRTALSLG